jgi:hypothetical protein
MRPIIIVLFLAMLTLAIEGRSQAREEFGTPVAKTVNIYPNPAGDQSEYINVRVGSLKSDNVKLSLHNIIGNQINVETEVIDEHELRMRIKELAAGYYFVTVRDEASNFRCTYKVLKK